MDENKHPTVRRREKKTKRLNMRVSDSELAELNELSYKENDTISNILRRAVRMYVGERKQLNGWFD